MAYKDKKYVRHLEEAIAERIDPVKDFAHNIIINDKAIARPGKEDKQTQELMICT